MKFSPSSVLIGAASVALVGALGMAQIVRLDLNQMVAQTDGAIYGTIVEKEVIRIDHPIDGPELYYTTLFIEGRLLGSTQTTTVGVTFAGGFIDDVQGVWNSEAPTADETRLGNRVLAFYKWSDNMGGDLAANALYAAHGGLYTTLQAGGETIVQGRGDGYAIRQNATIINLEERVVEIRESQK